jgi:DNA polymerase
MNDRTTRYRKLVSDRKACGQCEELVNGSSLRAGVFDSTEIGPWTRWLGDLGARVLVVGQDWGDQRAFEKLEGLNDPSATNKMLRRLSRYTSACF